MILLLLCSTKTYSQFQCYTQGQQSAPIYNCGIADFDTTEFASNYPIATIKVAFHFEAAPNGDNFTCNPNDPIIQSEPLLYAPTFKYWILTEINRIFKIAYLKNGVEHDARIRFELADPSNNGCNSYYFYDFGENIQQTDAFDIIFKHDYRSGLRFANGSTNNGFSHVNIYDVLQYYLLDTLNDWWSPARTIIHEFGHTRYLDHTFYCGNPCRDIDIDAEDECCGENCKKGQGQGDGTDCFGCSDRDLIMAYGTALHFTECEMHHLWTDILSKHRNDPYLYLDGCSDSYTGELVLNTGGTVVWDNFKVVDQDIRIKSGTTLKISCTLFMGSYKNIIVEDGAKLIVDDGKITSLCDEPWGAIHITGGNSDFDVAIINESIIENTQDAAVSMFPTLPWPEMSQHGNGILHAEDSYFYNTPRIVEFIAFQPSQNSSYIKNCVHIGGRSSITNWNCLGVLVKGNVFKEMRDYCLVTASGSFKAIDNQFNSGRANILFSDPIASEGSTIKGNTFNSAVYGIYSMGASMEQHFIKNNIFTNRTTGIVMDGHNSYFIAHNEFNQLNSGVHSINCGDYGNKVDGNDFNTYLAGIVTEGNNSEFLFINNCYNSGIFDNYINGKVAYVQGNSPRTDPSSANNCFTHSGNSNSNIYDIHGFHDPFYYIEPNDEIVNCKDAIKSDPNLVYRVQLGSDRNTNCGTIPSPPDIVTDYCNPADTIADIIAAQTWLGNKINAVEVSTSLDSIQRIAQLQYYNNCLNRVTKKLFVAYMEANQFQNARNVYASDTTSDSKVYLFSSYIYEGALQAASQYINNLSTVSTKLGDFKTIQSINLQRLQTGPSFTATATQLNTIYNIAVKDHSYSAYAKSLYFVLTDSLLTAELPAQLDSLGGQRIKKPENEVVSYKVFPNPFKNYLKIEVENGMNKEIYVRIYDINGKLKYKEKLNLPSMKVTTASWKDGLYIINFVKDSEIVKTEKAVLIH